MGRSFLSVLATVVVVALGVLSLLTSLTYLMGGVTEESYRLFLYVSLAVGAGYVLAGYGLYKGSRWGWFLATALVAFNLLGSAALYIYGYEVSYVSLFVDALVLVLMILTSREYGVGVPRLSKPSTPVPPPSAAIASVEKPRKFVRRKA